MLCRRVLEWCNSCVGSASACGMWHVAEVFVNPKPGNLAGGCGSTSAKKRMVQKSGMTVKGELSQYSFISGALAKGRLWALFHVSEFICYYIVLSRKNVWTPKFGWPEAQNQETKITKRVPKSFPTPVTAQAAQQQSCSAHSGIVAIASFTGNW